MDSVETSTHIQKPHKLNSSLDSLVSKIKNKQLKPPKANKHKKTTPQNEEKSQISADDNAPHLGKKHEKAPQKQKDKQEYVENVNNIYQWIDKNDQSDDELKAKKPKLDVMVPRQKFNAHNRGKNKNNSTHQRYFNKDVHKKGDSGVFMTEETPPPKIPEDDFAANKDFIHFDKSHNSKSKKRHFKDSESLNDENLKSSKKKQNEVEKIQETSETEVRSCLLRLRDLWVRSQESEKSSIAESVFLACEGHEYYVIISEIICSTVTVVLPFWTIEQILNFVSNFSNKKKLSQIVVTRYGGNFVEECCLELVNRLKETGRRLAEFSKMNDFAEAAVQAIGAKLGSILDEFYSTHLMRGVLCLLMEANIYSRSYFKSEVEGAGKKARYTGLAGYLKKEDQKKIPDIQGYLIAGLAEHAASVNITLNIQNKLFSMMIQTILIALNNCGLVSKADELFRQAFGINSDSSPEDIKSKVIIHSKDVHMSRIVEVLIDSPKSSLHKDFIDAIAENCKELCEHSVGNHVLQKTLRSDDGLKAENSKVLDELTSSITGILASGNFIVLSNMCQSYTNKSDHKQEKLFESIMESFECTDKIKCIALLAYLKTETVLELADLERERFSYPASVLIQSLLQWKSKQVLETLLTSLLASNLTFFTAFVCDKYMSHTMSAFAKSNLSHAKKSKLIGKMAEVMDKLISDKFGSRAIEDVFENVTIDLKKQVADSIASMSEDWLNSSQFPFIVMKKLRIQLFMRNPEKWVEIIAKRNK